MAIIHHYARADGGEFASSRIDYDGCAADFCVARIPPGTPFRVYTGRDAGRDITTDIDAMCEDGEFTVVEGAGGVAAMIISAVTAILISPMLVKVPTVPEAPNQQAESPNNSLTQRTNKPRPYERVYDVCGTVQTIPSDLMTPYFKFDDAGNEYEYGFYYVARGRVQTPVDDITDGDTKLMEITGSAATIYPPFKTPSSGGGDVVIGDPITEPLFITTRSNEVDGITLEAANEQSVGITGAFVYSNDITAGRYEISSNESLEIFSVGDMAAIENGIVDKDSGVDLSGTYYVIKAENNRIGFDPAEMPPTLKEKWDSLPQSSYSFTFKSGVLSISEAKTETDWFSITKFRPERLLINVTAPNGLYKENNDGKLAASVSYQIEHQLLDDDGQPIGPIVQTDRTITDKTSDEAGQSTVIQLGVASKVRVRARRTSDKDFKFSGSVVDEIKLRDVYGQTPDNYMSYGDITTIHTVRKRTVRATAVREPQLKMVVTELLYPYLGGGVFGAELVPNTQAVQSLIRLMRDPVVGGLTLSAANMDALITTQAEIETYFGCAEAGQFCYTFDDQKTTTQDIIETIARAIFCTSYREGLDIKLQFERPQPAPSMLFTHRSKIGKETWERSFNTRDSYDSVEFTWIDPDTNIRETITIPEEGGAKPHKIESKGVRNYRQAYWLAHRARQKDALRRVSVDFTATEEGIYVKPGRTIGVVKGSRVGTADGYVVAQNGLALTLSQEVDFVAGDTHSILLKRRDGSVESVSCEQGANKRTVQLLSPPSEPIYTGNSALKTEFSFGNDARHMAQTIVPATIEPSDTRSVKITGYNYDSGFYLFDGVSPFGRQFSDEFTGEFA